MKAWYKSKTIIANTFTAALAMLALVDENLLTALGVQNKTQLMAIVGVMVALINILLRTVTKKPISKPKTTK